MHNSRILKAIAKHKARKERIVFTNGCFDLLHVGHARYLAEARALGEVLVVGLNSDSSVRELKGKARPIVPEAERVEMLNALKHVDYVLLFDTEEDLETLISSVDPDFLVKGGDWKIEQITGYNIVTSRGNTARALPFHKGHSTTDIVSRIKQILKSEQNH